MADSIYFIYSNLFCTKEKAGGKRRRQLNGGILYLRSKKLQSWTTELLYQQYFLNFANSLLSFFSNPLTQSSNVGCLYHQCLFTRLDSWIFFLAVFQNMFSLQFSLCRYILQGKYEFVARSNEIGYTLLQTNL